MSTNNKPIITRQSHAVLANVLLVSHIYCYFTRLKARGINLQNMRNL